MTIDVERSIYVGGLSYDASQDTIRRVFDVYGAVVAVKIVNERGGGRGKCYGFVTFTNPRSAIDAISDMDGRTIDGQVVRVNGVRTRGGGRSGFGRESFRRDIESGREWDRGRDRERDYDREREQYRNRSSDRSREHDLSRDYDLERERGYEHVYDHDRARDSFLDRGRDHDRDVEDNDIEVEHGRNLDRDWERDRSFDLDREGEMDRANGHDNFVEPENSRKWNGSSSADRHCREILTNLSDDYDDQLEEQLQRSSKRLEELNKEILQMEERLEEKGKSVLDLQQKSKKLEEALINAKKTSSYRKTQLTKLHKCFLQVKDYAERLKSSEKQLQSLVDEARYGDISDDPLCSEILANGNI